MYDVKIIWTMSKGTDLQETTPHSLADLGGRVGHTHPLQDPILSFSHTFSPKCAHIGCPRPLTGPCPPREILDPPLPLLTKLEAKQELKNQRCEIDDRLTLMPRKYPINLFPSYHFPSIPSYLSRWKQFMF